MKINTLSLNDLARYVHEQNKRWWVDINTGAPLKRNRGELLMLVITELAEAVEGIRKDLMDDKLPHRKMEEVEMADAYIRLLDYAGGFGFELDGGLNSLRTHDNQAEQVLEICIQIVRIYHQHSTEFEAYYIADCLSLIRHYCELHDLDLIGAVEEKLAFNATREDHKHEVRKRDGGKKF